MRTYRKICFFPRRSGGSFEAIGVAMMALFGIVRFIAGVQLEYVCESGPCA